MIFLFLFLDLLPLASSKHNCDCCLAPIVCNILLNQPNRQSALNHFKRKNKKTILIMKQRTVCVENESLVMMWCCFRFCSMFAMCPLDFFDLFFFSYFTAVTYDAFIGIERKMLIKMKNEMKSNKNIYLSEIWMFLQMLKIENKQMFLKSDLFSFHFLEEFLKFHFHNMQ